MNLGIQERGWGEGLRPLYNEELIVSTVPLFDFPFVKTCRILTLRSFFQTLQRSVMNYHDKQKHLYDLSVLENDIKKRDDKLATTTKS